MAIKKVVLIGAGGNLGPHVLTNLLDGGFEVTVLSRESSKSTFPAAAKVHRISDDYPADALVEAFKGQDAVVSTVAGAAIDTQKRFIDAAVAAGVHRFIPGEFGNDPQGEDLKHPVYAQKHDIIQYLVGKQGQGLTWTGVANGPFFDWGLRVGFLGFDIPKRTASVIGEGDRRLSTTTLEDVGQAVKGVLQHPEATANRTVHIQSFYVSPNEIIASLEKVTGSKFEVTNIDRQTFIPEQEAKLKQGDQSAMFKWLWAIALSGDDWTAQLDDKLLGIKERDLDSVVREVVKGIEKA